MQTQSNRLEQLLMAVFGVLTALILYAWFATYSELNRTYDIPAAEFDETLAGSAERGEKLATIRGCIKCHGDELTGKGYFIKPPKGVISIAPNLTRKIRDYTPTEFATRGSPWCAPGWHRFAYRDAVLCALLHERPGAR